MRSVTYRRNGATLNIPVGFSWTTFIFGWWPSVFRSHWKLAWTFMAVDLVAIWFTTAVFQGRDWLLTILVFRGVCAYFRNAELNKDVHKDGWRTEADLSVVKTDDN